METPARRAVFSLIGRALGAPMQHARRFLYQSGGVRLAPQTRSERHLSGREREEISRGIAAGESARQLAKRLGRSPSTVSREIARNGCRDRYGPPPPMQPPTDAVVGPSSSSSPPRHADAITGAHLVALVRAGAGFEKGLLVEREQVTAA
ncbi:helix-turn-helix domain-containing protein [Streptomyces sp. NPDC014734]|uniref:helix-turn-helix domain-containing protein n=1 Tax=Streptomyces sp. NPDC014734 TaxID=3364886 RepID=UPI0036FF7D65